MFIRCYVIRLRGSLFGIDTVQIQRDVNKVGSNHRCWHGKKTASSLSFLVLHVDLLWRTFLPGFVCFACGKMFLKISFRFINFTHFRFMVELLEEFSVCFTSFMFSSTFGRLRMGEGDKGKRENLSGVRYLVLYFWFQKQNFSSALVATLHQLLSDKAR